LIVKYSKTREYNAVLGKSTKTLSSSFSGMETWLEIIL